MQIAVMAGFGMPLSAALCRERGGKRTCHPKFNSLMIWANSQFYYCRRSKPSMTNLLERSMSTLDIHFPSFQFAQLEVVSGGAKLIATLVCERGKPAYEISLRDILVLKLSKFPDTVIDCTLIESGSLRSLEGTSLEFEFQRLDYRHAPLQQPRRVFHLALHGEATLEALALRADWKEL